MEGYTRNVLVVGPDPVERTRLAAALEGEGFDVLLCPGPSAPEYGCIGATKGRCPLATDGCVVVLDLDLDADAAVEGTTAEELLGFYLGSEHRVVALSHHPLGLEDARLLDLRRHPEPDVLLSAVWRAASPGTSESAVGEGVWT